MKKKETESKLTGLNKTEKLPQAAHEVKEAERQVESTKKAFDGISKELRAELNEFDAQKVRELQQTMIDYVESMRTLQHQIVKSWEAFLPEVKAIAQ